MSRISTFDINYVVWLKLSASCDIILHLNFNKMKIYLKIMWHINENIFKNNGNYNEINHCY